MRLEGWDYSSQGYYYITICVQKKAELLCQQPLRRGAQCAPDANVPLQSHDPRGTPTFPLTDEGREVERAILQIPMHYDRLIVDKYVIMPNHVHLILAIRAKDHVTGADGRTLCAPTISRVVRMMKEAVTKKVGYSFWQKSYHDHIIRNEADYRRIWQYIDTNPAQWHTDDYYKG
jgi:REP element-mobilizing transposase RayT